MSILAWHFVGNKLRNGDPVPSDGEWLKYKGPLVMCQSGLHASIDPFDALQYAPGPILCRVECDGAIVLGDDKLVCSRRRIIKRLDATEGLRYFARMQALSVAHLWDIPDVVLEYLITGNSAASSAAWSVAYSAAESAASSAADSAASSAANSAASSAADSAAESAAWSVAYSAAESVAYSAAWSAARSAVFSAAWSAAWSAAKSAAWSVACNEWNLLVNEAFTEVL